MYQELNNGEHISCTCNGATAGCTVKFCHRRLVLLQDVANRLLNKYENAIKASHENILINTHNWDTENKGILTADSSPYTVSNSYKDTLVFLDNVDYCSTNKGVYSSTGRRCSLDKSSLDGCDKICCGKGHRERRIEIHSKCKCKFVYCCNVACETCIRYDTIYECL
jgi:wnt family.